MKNRLLLLVMVLLGSCAEMNDKHDEFLARGETVYIGKVDSVQAYPGKNKLLMKYWISDPRAKDVTVYWGVNDSKYKVIPIEPHSPTDAQEVTFDGNDGITEGNHTFHWIASDNYENKSMKFETLASVYGDQYQAKLLNRRVLSTDPKDNGDIEVEWAASSSSEELGVEIYYTDNDNQDITEYHPLLGTRLTLSNVDITKGITYSTLYVPAPTAIDTFYTNSTQLEVKKIVNVARGKPVTASHANDWSNAAHLPVNAVDGNHATNATRWVATTETATEKFPHYLEIDLQGEFTISSFKTWNGNNAYSNPITKIELHALIGDQWVIAHSVAGNTDAQYGADFTPVTTSKIRFYGYSEIRLYEIEVYSIIRY